MQVLQALEEYIEASKSLPTLPHILLKLIETYNQDANNIKELAKIIEKDPSLCAKIIGLTNTVPFSSPYAIDKIEHGISVLGTNTIKNLIYCASVEESFRQTKNPHTVNLKRFWRHSMKCAFMARLISIKIDYDNPGNAFLAGLFHDIGKLVLLASFPEKHKNQIVSHKDQNNLIQTEEVCLPAAHCNAGALLLNTWGLPTYLSDPALYHHETIDKIHYALPLVKIIYMANALCREPTPDDETFSTASDLFGISISELEKLLSSSAKEVKEASDYLEINVEPQKKTENSTSKTTSKIQENLARHIRDTSLIGGTLQDLFLAGNQDTIIETIKQNLQTLFNLKKILILLYNPVDLTLRAKKSKENEHSSFIDDLIIPLNMKDSLLIASLIHKTSLNSFEKPNGSTLVILDEQISRFLNTEGFVCIPMISDGEWMGVIAAGLDGKDYFHLSKNIKPLNNFAEHAAKSIHTDNLKTNRFHAVNSEKMKEVSDMVRNVTHEVNTPLGIIKNYINILGMKLSEKDVVQDEIRIIKEEIDRISMLLHKLYSFSTDKTEKNEPVNINEQLRDLVKIMRESLVKNSKVKIKLDLDKQLPFISTKKDSLKQVFLNLIKNAIEAMPDGGGLKIQTRYIPNPVEGKTKNNPKESKGSLEITVCDEGAGIPPEIEPKVFEPHISTKEENHSGIGLSIVHGIVKALHGTIVCMNNQDKGATFKVNLPAPNNLIT